MKKLLSLLTALLICLVCANAFAARRLELPIDPNCEAWALADAEGNIVAGENEDKAFDMCGCTRLMSALVIAELLQSGHASASDVVTISRDAAKTGGTSAFLTNGGEYAFEKLYSAMLLCGANDAAYALSEFVSGSETAFLERMNAMASDMDISPVFVNCTGHNAKGQSMSAAQAAAIGAKAATHKSILQSAKQYTGALTHESGRITELVNPNRLVKTYSGCDGLATGSSREAGYSGIYTAMRDGKRFIAAVAGAKNDAARQSSAKMIFDYAFSSLESVTAIEAGKGVARDIEVDEGRKKTVHGVAGGTVVLTIKKGEIVTKQLQLDSSVLTAPVIENQRLGEVIILIDNEPAAAVPIIPSEPVEKASWLLYVSELSREFVRAG